MVTIDRDRWNWKIINKHPALIGNEQCVVTCLQDPLYVMDDVDRPGTVECFYRPFTLPEPFHRTYLKVVVEYSAHPATGTIQGRVLTAYSTNDIKQGETQRWPTENS